MDYERKPTEEKTVMIRAFRDGKQIYHIPVKKENELPKRLDWLEEESKINGFEDDFRLVAKYRTRSKEKSEKELTVTVDLPEDYEYIEFERLGGQASICLNGEMIGDTMRCYGRQSKTSNRPYRFYADFKKGKNDIRIVFTYDETDHPLISGTVKIGKRIQTPWQVKLHYGKARVFVKSQTPKKCKVTASVK